MNVAHKTTAETFHFTIFSNGRVDGPMKFEMINTSWGYNLRSRDDEWLIKIGELWIKKEEKKHLSRCHQHEAGFDYHGRKKVLTGGTYFPSTFTPMRILVYQMK